MIRRESSPNPTASSVPDVVIRRMAEKSKVQYSELLNTDFAEILPGMRENSALMILDFSQLPPGLPDSQNISNFFEAAQASGRNPRLPEERQRFNNAFLNDVQKRYLIGRYAENRIAMLQGSSIAAEGRTFHLGIDIFTSELETLQAPYEGTVIAAGQEAGAHTYGYYVILEHTFNGSTLYSLYGHLSEDLPEVGMLLQAGQPFARLGDYLNNENGGWSRHVHFQLLRGRPAENEIPIGYSTAAHLEENLTRFPDPNLLLRLSL